MFDMLASKIGEAQAFADGLAANLDVINMDRLLEEQEREEKSKDESLRLLRTSRDPASPDSAVTGFAGRVEREDNNGNSGALGDVEMPQLGTVTDAEQEHLQQQHRSRLSSPNGAPSEHSSSSFRDRFASMEDGGGNFEDEFDPILASIRKPPPQRQPASTAAAKHAPPLGEERQQAPPLPDNPEHDTGRPSAGSTFAASFLSMLPGDMRAKAGEVMAQSSARITESASAFRSALDPAGTAPPASDKFKRRQSDPTYGGNSDLEDGRGAKSGGRRAAAGEGDEDEVRLMNVNELLSEEERQQLASFSGGAGGAGRVCGWRSLRKYIPVFVGIGLLGLFYLWRWTSLLVGNSSANGGVESLGPERA